MTEVKNIIKQNAKTETGKDTEDVDFTVTIGRDYQEKELKKDNILPHKVEDLWEKLN